MGACKEGTPSTTDDRPHLCRVRWHAEEAHGEADRLHRNVGVPRSKLVVAISSSGPGMFMSSRTGEKRTCTGVVLWVCDSVNVQSVRGLLFVAGSQGERLRGGRAPDARPRVVLLSAGRLRAPAVGDCSLVLGPNPHYRLGQGCLQRNTQLEACLEACLLIACNLPTPRVGRGLYG